ncbi:MAG: hypothetical protein RL173_2878 [Fibrobacterota bacterium]|jgi:putative NADPH-quinone reductase
MKNADRILILDGHPNDDSFCRSIAAAYEKGALAGGAEVRRLTIGHLAFDPILRHGFQRRMELEPDLVKSQQDILWAEHIVLVHPVWWSDMPALLKGFIDRVFLPGFAFKYHETGVLWDKLLKGRTGHILYTQDAPNWYYRFFIGRPSVNALRKGVLEFCGVSPVRATPIGPIKKSTDGFRRRWLDRVEEMGRKRV